MKRNLIIAVAVIVVAGGVWYGLSQGSAPAPLLTPDVSSTGSPTQESADREIVGTLLALRAVSLSGNIFSDPVFRSLNDNGTTVAPEPIGRSNPFAPLARKNQPATPASTGPFKAR